MTEVSPAVLRGPLAAFAASGLAAAALGFLPATERRIALYAEWALPIVLASLLVALACAAAAWRERAASPPTASGGRDRVVDAGCLLAIAALVAAIAYAVPAQMRIQADEYMIGGVALGIWHGGAPLLPSSGFYSPDGMLVPESVALDKRGLLVPLLVAILHHVRGFDPGTAFVRNLVVGFAALASVFAFVRRCAPASTALLAAALLAAHPVFAWAIRSVSLEPLNLALLAGSATLALAGLARPTPWRALSLAWLAPLVAQTRYESIVFSLLALALAFVVLARSPHRRVHVALIAATPLAFLPYAWQRAASFTHGLDAIGATHAFGLDHFARHLPALAELYLLPSAANPLGPALPLLCAGWAVLALARRPARPVFTEPDARRVAALYAVAVAVVSAIVLAYAWGDLRTEVVLRLGLPLMLLGAVAAAFAVRALAGTVRRAPAIELACAAVAIVFAMPAIASDAGYRRMDLGPALNEALRWQRARHPECRFVFVGAATPYFLLHGEHAVTVGQIDAQWPTLAERVVRNRADAFVLVQVADPRSGAPLPLFGDAPRGLRVEPIHVRDVNPFARLRLSVLTPPTPAPAVPPRAGCDARALLAAASRDGADGMPR